MTTEVTDPQIVANTAPPGGPPGTQVPVTDPAPTPQEDLLAPVVVTPPAGSTQGDDGTVQFEPTGDVGLDLALEFFGKLGLSPESPELVEATKGNFAYLEAKLAALGDKATGFDRYVALAKDAQVRAGAEAKQRYETALKTVEDAVGGKETWNAVRDFAQKNLKPEVRDAVRSALNGGGVVAEAMAQFLHKQALAAQGTTITGREAVTADTPAAATVALGPLPTREAWREEYRKGLDKHGPSFEKTPEYAALVQRFPR